MKLAGLLLVCFCPVYMGLHFSSDAKKEVFELEGFIAMVREIHYAISFSLAKQGDIFKSFTHPALEKNGFLPLLRTLPVGSESILTQGFRCAGAKLAIDTEARKILDDFAAGLGKVSLERQNAECELCIHRLEHIVSEKRARLPARQKLSRSLGLLIGGCTLLILL